LVYSGCDSEQKTKKSYDKFLNAKQMTRKGTYTIQY